MTLPEGYRVERDPDVWILYGPGGEVVARFVSGVSAEEIEQAARDHARGDTFRELAAAVVVGVVYGAMLG